MKLTIKTVIKPVKALNNYEIVPIDLTATTTREVYINDERVPPSLEEIILAGLDVFGAEYLNKVKKEMEVTGYEYP